MPDGTGVVPQQSGSLMINFPAVNAQKEVVIAPASIGSNAAVVFTNNTGGVVRLWIPNGDSLFAAPPQGRTNYNDISIPNGQAVQLDVKPAPTRGVYPYHVFCNSIDDYARGGSPPVMSCP